jgi:drug/metabolite transporter (DMT)-like permease
MTQPVGTITPLVILGLLYVGIVASVAAFLCWNAGIGRIGAARGGIFLNLVPLFTASMAVPL